MVYVDARIGGTAAAPAFEGSVTLRDAGFTLPVLFQRVHDVNGRIDVDRKKVDVRSIAGRLDGGRFALSGTVDLERNALGRASFELDADALPIHIPDTAQLLVSARLNIEGTPDRASAQGKVSLLEGLYYRDFKLNLAQNEPRSDGNGTLPALELPFPYLRNLALDVALTRRNPFTVDNNIASLVVNPDLHVTGTLDRPIVTGRAVVESGSIEYWDRTFTVRKGLIDFLSPYRTEPSFDIVGDTRIRDWLITLRISGKPDNLDFTLTSDPMIEDADILSLLIAGRTASEFIAKQAKPTQSAATMLTDIIASSIGRDIRKAAGLDVLETEAEIGDVPVSPDKGGGTRTGLERVRITLGKELSRRLKIEYSAEFRAGGLTQRADADYLLLENTYLKGFQDSAGRYGGALQYRLEFR